MKRTRVLILLLVLALVRAMPSEGLDEMPNRGAAPFGAVDDQAMVALPAGYRPTSSPWQAAEAKRYENLLPKGAYDVLVVPIQVQQFGFSRSQRSIMSAQMTAALRRAGAKVADSYVVLRALGENSRRFEPEAVYALAARLKVRSIVWSYVGHDRQGQMSVRVALQQKKSDSDVLTQAGSAEVLQTTIAANVPPMVAYQNLLPEILPRLGYSFTANRGTTSATTTPKVVPDSLHRLTTERTSPADQALYFLVLAALTPSASERTMERFAEKSWLATELISSEHPDYRFLRARALMLLGLRPAALAALKQPRNAEEHALLAILNGNLPSLTAETARIQAPLKRLLAELDLAAMQRTYGIPEARAQAEVLKAVNLPGTAWPLFLARSLGDRDAWARFENLYFKDLLDAELPIQGFTAEGIVSGAGATANPQATRDAANMSVHNHIRQLMAKDPAKYCCSADPAAVSLLDYLDLVDAVAFDNLARQIHFLSEIQGRSDAALTELSRLEPVYQGHPHLGILRAQAEARMAQHADGSMREGYLKAAYSNALDTLYWEQGQTADAVQAWGTLVSLRRDDYGFLQNLYVADVPYRSNYPSWDPYTIESSLRSLDVALANATFDTSPVYAIHDLLVRIMQKPDQFARYLKSIEGRFAGHTGIVLLAAQSDLLTGDVRAAESKYREAIRLEPSSWEPYKELTELLLRETRVKESAKIAMSYPGFRPGFPQDKVGISNKAYELGSLYFWSGHFDMARPLYKIAADLNTGAHSGMASEVRLHLMNGNYGGAIMATYARASRYNVSYAYRDYLGFLHATGLSKDAWDGFDALVARIREPHIWEAALAGHRKSGASQQAIFAWLQQEHLRNAGTFSSYAANYLLRASVTDRVPEENTERLINEIERLVWWVNDGYGHVVRPSGDNRAEYILGPAALEGSTLPLDVFKRTQKRTVGSDLRYFAQAYRLLKTGDYKEATRLLGQAAQLYDTSQPSIGYLLPYFAFVAAKSGDVTRVEAELEAFRPELRGFDYLLARAVLVGLAGNTEESLALLHKALYRRPFTELRPLFTEYQYGEILELLFEATGKAGYRDRALAWARVCQKTQPWVAWAYAMEAKLAPPGSARRDAIAMANYLDPNSERLKSVSKKERAAAIKGFEQRNPFLKLQETSQQDPV